MTKELEDLIKATLEDGILEDYEKEALVKRAQKEGMDLVELEIYINSELQKRKRELKEKNDALDAQYEKEQKEAIGPICPRCGKQVPPLTLKCECGYEFVKGMHESSVKLLSEKIDKIKSRSLNGIPNSDEWKADRDQRDQEILDTISIFPVPNTKEDIVEFLALSAPKAQKMSRLFGSVFGRITICFCILAIVLIALGIIIPETYTETLNEAGLFEKSRYVTHVEETPKGLILGFLGFWGIIASIVFSLRFDRETLYETSRWNKSAKVWKTKFDQVLMKGRSLMGDPDFQRQLDYYENKVK